MPEELWRSAVLLARTHGVYAVARALRVDYGALKKRCNDPEACRKTRDMPGKFIELPRTPVFGRAEPDGVVVELSDADGAKLVVRLAGGEGLEVRSLAEAFWSRRR
jgi:hypothetical protein